MGVVVKNPRNAVLRTAVTQGAMAMVRGIMGAVAVVRGAVSAAFRSVVVEGAVVGNMVRGSVAMSAVGVVLVMWLGLLFLSFR